MVYTMGKVGSSTVYHTLRQSKISPLIYHVHFLTSRNIDRITKKYEKSGHLKQCVTFGSLVRGDIDHLIASQTLQNLSQYRKWHVVSLVRDPVATFFSHVFQKPQVHRPKLLDKNGRLDKNLVQHYILNHYSKFDPKNDYISNWFDNEFLQFTGIDVYSHGFTSSLGRGIIRESRFNLAIVSLEKIEHNLSAAISELLSGKQVLDIVSTNLRSNSNEKDLYQYIKNEVIIPKGYLSRVYATKYAKHFFSFEFRERMIEKWSRKR